MVKDFIGKKFIMFMRYFATGQSLLQQDMAKFENKHYPLSVSIQILRWELVSANTTPIYISGSVKITALKQFL